jgi:hypothetical protein
MTPRGEEAFKLVASGDSRVIPSIIGSVVASAYGKSSAQNQLWGLISSFATASCAAPVHVEWEGHLKIAVTTHCTSSRHAIRGQFRLQLAYAGVQAQDADNRQAETTDTDRTDRQTDRQTDTAKTRTKSAVQGQPDTHASCCVVSRVSSGWFRQERTHGGNTVTASLPSRFAPNTPNSRQVTGIG